MESTVAETKIEETMVEPPEVVEVESVIIACDGGADFGHPRVFLNMEGKGWVDCTYCGRRFMLKAGTKAAAGH